MIPSQRGARRAWAAISSCLVEFGGGAPRRVCMTTRRRSVQRTAAEPMLDRRRSSGSGARSGWASIVLQARRPRSQGAGRAGQRLLGDELHAGPPLRRSSHDFNAQLADWLRASEQAGPLDAAVPARRSAIVEDRGGDDGVAAGAARPGAAARDPRLARDHWVRVDTNDYSVQPTRDRPTGRGARRPRRGRRHLRRRRGRRPPRRGRWAKHRTITDPAHDIARERCAPRTDRRAGRRSTRSRSATWPSTTGPPGRRDGRPHAPSRPAISPTCAGR